MIRAALHLHSTYSDGELPLAELRRMFADVGCRVLGMADHAEYFDSARLAAFARECDELSDAELLVLPGLEFEVQDQMHIVGYGVCTLRESDDPEAIFRHIADKGGVSVVAHPKEAFFSRIRGFTTYPDGVETWNTKYDGRFAPRPSTFDLVSDLRESHPGLHAYYGIDFHWRHQYHGLHTLLHLQDRDLSRAAVIGALRRGKFDAVAAELVLPSDGQIGSELLDRFARLHRRGRMMRTALKRAKRAADVLGIPIPDRLKSQLRRLL